jgi:hypothetical protein
MKKVIVSTDWHYFQPLFTPDHDLVQCFVCGFCILENNKLHSAKNQSRSSSEPQNKWADEPFQ